VGHGQALTQEHGSPGIASIFLFAAGAAAAWGMLRFLSVGESSSSGLQLAGSPHLVRAGAIHVAAIAGAIAAAMLAGAVVGGVAALVASASRSARTERDRRQFAAAASGVVRRHGYASGGRHRRSGGRAVTSSGMRRSHRPE